MSVKLSRLDLSLFSSHAILMYLLVLLPTASLIRSRHVLIDDLLRKKSRLLGTESLTQILSIDGRYL